MFYTGIMIIFFIVCLYLVYNKYFNKKYRTGEWLEINKDINIKYNLDWDVSSNSSVKIASFNKWKRFFKGDDFYTSLKRDECFVMGFRKSGDSYCILDVCDKEMNSIHHIVDPGVVIFSSSKYYKLEPGKEYIFFLRDNHLGRKTHTILRKYKKLEDVEVKGESRNDQTCCIDEDNLEEHFYQKCEDIREAMKKRGYHLCDIVQSEEYLSFPNNSISNKLEVQSELGDVIILVCTNKSKTSGMKNHTIEINSGNNNLNWYPEDDEIVSHLLLDNCDQDDVFRFYERTTNVSNGSNILPFRVMIFKNG